MAKGEKVEGTSTIDNGMKQVQAVLYNPITIHKALIDQVLIADKFWTRDQVYGSAAPK
jgi:ABC-type xylose transport system substrate-binding protein